jgi:hypothetical protein
MCWMPRTQVSSLLITGTSAEHATREVMGKSAMDMVFRRRYLSKVSSRFLSLPLLPSLSPTPLHLLSYPLPPHSLYPTPLHLLNTTLPPHCAHRSRFRWSLMSLPLPLRHRAAKVEHRRASRARAAARAL